MGKATPQHKRQVRHGPFPGRSDMTPVRLMAAALLGALVATVVWVWPVLPVWTGGAEDMAVIQGFTSDGAQVITSHLAEGDGQLPYVCYWDVSNGKLVATVPFRDPDLRTRAGYTFN